MAGCVHVRHAVVGGLGVRLVLSHQRASVERKLVRTYRGDVQVVEEVLDFDQAVGKALEFAAGNGETLVIVTADHETGGMAILDGSVETGMVKGGYATGGHTGVMVPIFAYGPGASEFIGIMENTDIHAKIRNFLLK